LGRIEVIEQIFTRGKGAGSVRPFSQSAEVHCRGYSVPLQRIITDFGADAPFGQIPAKLQEHHGITVPISSAQAITERHAAQMLQIELGRLPDTMPHHASNRLARSPFSLFPSSDSNHTDFWRHHGQC
jgi:hypothetical protein